MGLRALSLIPFERLISSEMTELSEGFSPDKTISNRHFYQCIYELLIL
ncbi:hypothetical protein IFVP408_C2120247 [Vibrio parahaemolyticus]